MANVKIYLPDEEYAEIKQKADGAGLSISNYIRTVLKGSPLKNQDSKGDVMRAIKALIPTMAEAFGHTQNADQKMVDELNKILLDRYTQELGKE